jgi:pyridinium-3,5-bisthiocarboxylic acid mononucleotide nickel chelatase
VRLVYFDCSSGASGDMFLGALVDLGLPLDVLRGELSKLRLGGYRLEASRVLRTGVSATRVEVVLDGEAHPHAAEPAHGDVGQGQGHSHTHEKARPHGHHRGLREILALIEDSTLADAVKQRAATLFRRLAEAEGAVHGIDPERVHFHEVGAVDSIVDIVGSVVGLAWLGEARFVSSPVNVGSGTVKMEHGVFPVPPPATARLVQGAPIYGEGEGELLTPTGALIVTSHAASFGPLPPMELQSVGCGAGSRDTKGRPNTLRILVGNETHARASAVLVLEAELDDMSPQLLGPLMERVLAAGALDVYYTAIHMKKGRPGILVSVLAPPASREAVEEVLFAETTTLGVRSQLWDRTVLDREVRPVQTPYGPIGIKVGSRGGRVYNAQPEFDDCLRAAQAHGVPAKEVWAAALAAHRTDGAKTR